MAYGFTVNGYASGVAPAGQSVAVIKTISGARYFCYKIAETEAGTTSEWVLNDAPFVGTIMSFDLTKTSGDVTTLAPKLGKITGWTVLTKNHISYTGSPVSTSTGVHDQTEITYSLVGVTAPKIFGVSGVDTGTNNVLETYIVIKEGV